MSLFSDALVHLSRSLDYLDDSYEGWHVPGLDYLCLLRTPQLTIKLYEFDDCPHDKNDLLVWPHNHRYDFTHYTLRGEITNLTYRVDYSKRGRGLWHLRYPCWPKRVDQWDGTMPELRLLKTDTRRQWSLKTHEVHAIAATPGALALQIQGPDIIHEGVSTSMYVPQNSGRHGCGGSETYRKLPKYKAEQMAQLLRDALESNEVFL